MTSTFQKKSTGVGASHKELPSNVVVSNSGTIATVNNMDPQELLALVLNLEINQVISADGPNPDWEMQISEAMSNNSERFFEDPLGSILFPKGKQALEVPSFGYTFSSSEQKDELFKNLDNFLSEHVSSASLCYDVKTSVDEMFTNSIYNAPRISYDSRTSGEHKRGEVAQMPPGAEGKIEIGIFQEQMVVVCRDPFGSLNPRYILSKVHNCYVQGVGESINNSPIQGAGIGCFLIYQTCLAYYLAVKKNECTIVGTTFSLRKGHRRRSALPKNIHILDC